MDPATVTTLSSVTELLKFGIAGVFIIVLCFACWTLWRNNVALTNQLAKTQEDRIADVRLCTNALVNAAGSIAANAEGLKSVNATLQQEFQRRGQR